ncbi:MAG: S41 family peptidase [Phycisphaerales bacterium]
MPRFRLACVALIAGTVLSSALPASAQVAAVASAEDWSKSIWSAASGGHDQRLWSLLEERPAVVPEGAAVWLGTSADLLKANMAKREELRGEELKRVNEELDKHLADAPSDLTISRALRSAVELHMLSTDKPGVLNDARVARLRARAAEAARDAELRGDWFTSSELFARLDSLYEDTGDFKEDLRRQGTRLSMIRLYVPERFWELRNDRRLEDNEKPLPPYNPVGDVWSEKLAGITTYMAAKAVERGAADHVERTPLEKSLRGGIEAIRTMVTTEDLAGSFPGLRNPEARARMLASLAQEDARLLLGARPGDTMELMKRLMGENKKSVMIDEPALIHEFGNGAMAEFDEFSAIIWPDEVRRFNKSTQGNFIGVGIHIQLDELLNIRVVTPIEGTPAQRAGVRPGDIIKRVNGKSTLGFSLDQAVDVITGTEDTKVMLTLERASDDAPAGGAGDGPRVDEIDVSLIREKIEIPSVKGWKRIGAAEDSWEWFIDPELKIGYVRLSGFTEKTDLELDSAIRQMKAQNVRGLILDLRFNPGGLLEQAVAVTSRFVEPRAAEVYDGLIVSTHGPDGRTPEREYALDRRATLSNIPVVVLVNEGSASASEIVSGAIQDYAAAGALRGLVLGQRSFGKGSVQNVWQLPGAGLTPAYVKLTTQYYKLPGGRLIHRKPTSEHWGVEPNLSVEMLPKQIAEAFTLRQNADVLKLNNEGAKGDKNEPSPNPDDLIAKGLDLQLEHALVVLQTQTLADGRGHAQLKEPAETRTRN